MATGPTTTFWVERTDREKRYLRRYVRTSDDSAWTCEAGWHEARTELPGEWPCVEQVHADPMEHRDGPWPTHCDKGCGYEFTVDDTWQVWTDVIYRRPDTGEEWPMRQLPAGAMYDAFWMGDWAKGPDGLCLVVLLPTDPPHAWMVDARASNCGSPDDNVHKCWIRHGNPQEEPVTVDKAGAPTCNAGAGSIAVEGYHGFLQNGVLTPG